MSEKAPLERAFFHAAEYLDSIDERPVGATVDRPKLLARLSKPLGDEGVPAARVIDELVADVEGGLLKSSGGSFFAWAIGGTLPAALAADWLVSTWDQNAAFSVCSPAEGVIEEVCGKWLKDLLGLPSDASFAFVTGCQMAHTTALTTARHALYAERGVDVELHGLHRAPQMQIITGERFHESIFRAVRLLGLGEDSIVGQPDLDAVADCLEEAPDRPTVICLNAGEFNTGAFDPFDRAIDLARRYGAWVHVDGAFGLWAGASSKYRSLLKGCDRADSWATDGHKWLNVPFDSGFVFTAHPAAHKAAMTMRTRYIATEDNAAREPIDWNPEWSRRGRAVPTYAALRTLGPHGVANLVERCCDHARALVTRIGELPGAEVLQVPVINQGLVRFLARDGDHDRKTDEIIERVQKTGRGLVRRYDVAGSTRHARLGSEPSYDRRRCRARRRVHPTSATARAVAIEGVNFESTVRLS